MQRTRPPRAPQQAHQQPRYATTAPAQWRCGAGCAAYPYGVGVIFKAVGDARPYPDHGKGSVRDWADVPPRMVRLEELITTKRTLDLGQLLAEDSTFYGDLFAHVVEWQGNSTSRTGCTAPCVPRFNSDLPSTPASSCLTRP